MNSRLIVLLLAAHTGAALAQYKCTAANGAITFQQTPCVGAKAEQKLTVIPNGHPPPAAPASSASAPTPAEPGLSVDKRMLADYQRQHEREVYVQAVKTARDEKAARAQQRLADIAGARRQFGDDPANAAQLRDTLAQIDRRYDALSQLDDSRIAAAEAELAEFDKAPPPR
jgi:hypothetical protein